jgi:hypothetical protein
LGHFLGGDKSGEGAVSSQQGGEVSFLDQAAGVEDHDPGGVPDRA